MENELNNVEPTTLTVNYTEVITTNYITNEYYINSYGDEDLYYRVGDLDIYNDDGENIYDNDAKNIYDDGDGELKIETFETFEPIEAIFDNF